MNIQWFPGHMAKTRRLITENLKLVDIVVELKDARIPYSSTNPILEEILGNTPRVIALNKCDMADEDMLKKWVAYYKSKGITAVPVDSIKGTGIGALKNEIKNALRDKTKKEIEKGMRERDPRMMVVGIPNVGKSSFINKLSGRAGAKTGDRPGVTTTKQWIRISGGYELLDTPGILWPKFEDQMVGLKLALIGSMNDEVVHVDEMSMDLIKILRETYPGAMAERYGIDETPEPYKVLEAIAKSRNCLLKGEELDVAKAANLFIDDFRSGKLGKITLELPMAEEEVL